MDHPAWRRVPTQKKLWERESFRMVPLFVYQGGEREEWHGVLHHVQWDHSGHFKWVWVVVTGPVGDPESYPISNSKSGLVPVDPSLVSNFFYVLFLQINVYWIFWIFPLKSCYCAGVMSDEWEGAHLGLQYVIRSRQTYTLTSMKTWIAFFWRFQFLNLPLLGDLNLGCRQVGS